MGLLADVYRAPAMQDATNGGLSSAYDTVCIVNVDGPFAPGTNRPPVLLQAHPTVPGLVRVVPAYLDVGTQQYLPVPCAFMAGGNFLYTSDSRFARKAEELTGHAFYAAVPIHDRLE